MKKFCFFVAALIISNTISFAQDTNCINTVNKTKGNVADSIPAIIEEVKNGDRSHMKTLAEAYRYGVGVEKSLINALICYDIDDVNVVEETRRTYAEDPNDEFSAAFILLDIYDKRGAQKALEELKARNLPNEGWAAMMKKILSYSGDDISTFILSLINKDTSVDERFIAFSCYIINNKDGDEEQIAMTITNAMVEEVPFFYNKTGEYKLREYLESPEGNDDKLRAGLLDFKKANDTGFLRPINARKIFKEEIQDRIDLTTIFSTEELEQLERLGASTFAGLDDAEVVEMVPPEEVVELIEDDEYSICRDEK
ncbi:MAG: hypothetical protein K2N25_02510 [Muribaculaceae bacterium]|nr:hypothetical protein [Muribaculaceae bacterium]